MSEITNKKEKTNILKTRSVLKRIKGTQKFTPDNAEDEVVRGTTLVMDPYIWGEMGKPSTITITIKPGDHLNKEL